jgi:outer membrane protein TolC
MAFGSERRRSHAPAGKFGVRVVALAVGVTLGFGAGRARAEAAADATLTGERVLERAAFVRAVLERNPSVESARSGVRAAAARARQAGAFEDPMLDVGIAPLSIGASKVPFGYEVALSQKLPWFGKRSLEQSAAEAEAKAARLDVEAVERELALTAVELYAQYFVASRSLAINQEHAALLAEMRAGAVAAFASGRGSPADALQAEVELTHLEHEAVMLGAERDVTVAQMNALLHRAPELPLPPAPDVLSLPDVPDTTVARLESEATAQRPDIAALRERARAEQARAERAGRESWPDVTLTASYNSMWDMPEHRFMVGLGFNVPLQVGRRAAAADEARAERARFERDAERLSDTARAEVFVAGKRLEESRHVVELYEKRLLPVAKQQIDIARAGFATAQNPFFAVIEAERNLRTTELDYQLARSEYSVRRAELDRALGRVPAVAWKEDAR